MKSMKECCNLLDDMAKSISFDIEKPVNMNDQSPYYSPYKSTPGGYMPHPTEHWEEAGKEASDYREITAFYKDHFKYVNKSENVGDILEDLIKGGPGSGPRQHGYGGVDIESGYNFHPGEGDEGSVLKPRFADRAREDNWKDKIKKKEQESWDRAIEAKSKRDKEASKKQESPEARIRRMGAVLGKGDNMNKLFTTEETVLIKSVDEDKDLAKSIENNDYHLGGQPNLRKSSMSDSLLRNTHGEQFHSDADRNVVNYLTTTGQIPRDEVPEEYRLMPEAYANSKKSENDADVKKADADPAKDVEVEPEGEPDEQSGGAVDSPADDSGPAATNEEGEEMDEAEKEASDEEKKGSVKGIGKSMTLKDALNGLVKSEPIEETKPEPVEDNPLAGLAKACGYKDMDDMSDDAHKKAKKVKGKKMEKLHENSKGM